MNIEEIEELKESLLEMDPCIKFDEENDDKLIGYQKDLGVN